MYDEQLEEFEKDVLGRSLPSDYRSFLLQSNGGVPDRKRFATSDGKIESMVRFLLPLASDEEIEDNLASDFEGFVLASQVPSDMLPIAVDPIENRLLLGIGSEPAGVFYWAWDEEDEDHEASMVNIHHVADSFSKFMESLR